MIRNSHRPGPSLRRCRLPLLAAAALAFSLGMVEGSGQAVPASRLATPGAGAPLAAAGPLTAAPSVGTPSDSGVVGIDEHLGARVPLDLPFRDEQGNRITLGTLAGVPLILALVYYNCPNVCDLLLTGMAGMIRGLDAVPGRDYRVVTVSIDEHETPADAVHAKRLTLETIEQPFPDADWRFLTGERGSIDRLADAVGYRFARRDGGFDHPVCIIFVSPDGTVTHYIYGADFLPADVKLSLLGAQTGTVAPTIAKLLRFCFRTDPASHRMVFDMLRVAATVTLALTLVLVVFLARAGRKRRRRITEAAAARRQADPRSD
ncbi:MAG TPA: SCO family protein [Rectinemataceae bacterium]|nr:SCO family protein [Rectinemataceae bacterium]